MVSSHDCQNDSLRREKIRAGAGGLSVVFVGWLVLKLWPELELRLLVRGGAWLASLFSGSPLVPVEQGWMLPAADVPVVVTTACSGADFFLMVAAIIAWHRARGEGAFLTAILAGLSIALPLALVVNALRIVAVTQAHRWAIPLLPGAYGSFLHLLTGVAVFLPSLIALNLFLENHGIRRRSAATQA